MTTAVKPPALPEAQLICQDCGRPLRIIDERPGKEAAVCPIALEAQHRGLLGKPGRKHKVVWIYTMSYVIKALTNHKNVAEEGDVIVSKNLRDVYLVTRESPRSTGLTWRKCEDEQASKAAIEKVQDRLGLPSAKKTGHPTQYVKA